MSDRKKRVLEHLRDLYGDEGPGWVTSTADISEELEIPELELYDHQHDTGILFELMREGSVYRCDGRTRATWSWQAAGARIVWD